MINKRARSITNRHWSLNDEIRGHLIMWQNDKQFSRLSHSNQVGINFLVDAFEVDNQLAEMKKQHSNSTSGSRSIEHEKRKLYIAIYKQKFLELTDLNCEETFTGATNVIISTHITKLEKAGGTVEEYLHWMFDYLNTDGAKKLLPPSIKLTLSTSMFTKFMYENKGRLKLRKQDISDAKLKVEIMQLGLDIWRETQDEDIAKNVDKLGKGQYTLKKVLNFYKTFAKKTQSESILKKVNELEKTL